MRYEFGVPGAVEETYLRGASAFNCIGCHAVARDGTRIAVGRGIPTTNVQVFDVATRAMVYQNFRDSSGTMVMGRPNFFSFNPDASMLVTSNPHGLNIADAAGTLILTGITSGYSTMPDWSADGNHIVYVTTSGGPAIEAPAVSSGSIVTVDFDGTSWGGGTTLAAANGGNNYHPTYSPDSAWVLYNRSPSNIDSMGGSSSSSGGDCVSDAEMWFIAADGTGAATQLEIGPVDRPTAGICASWPKFDPTTYVDHGHPLFWVAWATARGYGLRYADGSIMQIWMAAFDPTLAAAGMNPMHRAIRLPFQNIMSGNHIAQWVTTVERMGCSTDADCGGEFCRDGRCYEQPPEPI
jgi:TolB protein